MRSLLCTALLVWALPLVALADPPPAAGPGVAPSMFNATGNLPVFSAADPGAPPVTLANLLDNESFWPYHVLLVRAWQAPGRQRPLRRGERGVLLWVEPAGVAHIDFGRSGRFDVPVDATDLVENANRIRLGELQKMGPNQALSIGPRLVDGAAARLEPFPYDALAGVRGYLEVFADPGTDGFAELAAALAPLGARKDVISVLFPQGGRTDAQVLDRLHEVDWKVPFVYGFLCESYTRSLLRAGDTPPFLLLQTNEGRVLYRGPWTGDAVTTGIASAMDAAFGPAPAGETARVALPARR